MPMTMIKGHYRILHAQPDGDSIRFYPNDAKAFQKAHICAHPNQAGGAQLRLDGIDTLETHYNASVGDTARRHQPLQFAHGAASALLQFFGFHDVVRDQNETVTAGAPKQVTGYILTRFADKYGRCVAFAFKGNHPQSDLSEVFLDEAALKKSANYHMLTAGLAFPTYYRKLYPDIRQAMTKAVLSARGAGKGLWPADQTTQGTQLVDLQTVTDQVVILPKLFRRLIDYLAINDGSNSLAGFQGYLASRNDRIYIISDGHSTGFDFVVEVNGQDVRLTRAPEDLIFDEAAVTCP